MKINKQFKKILFITFVLIIIIQLNLFSAGLLKPKDGKNTDVYIKSHTVNVTINNGFAKTEIDQVFYNQSNSDLEAIYSFPIPKNASLSEVSLWINGQEIIGEVIPKEQAKAIYEEQKSEGKDTALAEQNSYKTFRVNVYPVRAMQETRVRLVYYQPIEIDLNIGRFVYPLAEGNTDEEQLSFWSTEDNVHENIQFNLTLKSAFPIREVRLPGFQDQAIIDRINSEDGYTDTYNVSLEIYENASLSKDIVFYYRLDDSVPARVELIPYKESSNEDGTFMIVVTPGVDLQPITNGTDWTFILDVSGSMDGDKIRTLTNGVNKVIGKMSGNDRFRIIVFNDSARDFTNGYVHATEENINKMMEKISNIQAGGSTDVYSGLEKAYKGIDSDRITGMILVTDGEANVGKTEYRDFKELIQTRDLRLFTVIIGNSANEPLLERMAKDTGGFSINVSSNDDLVGRILQAKAKVLNECIYSTELKINNKKVKNLTPKAPKNLYLGEQLVLFGQYIGSGVIDIEFSGRIAGEEKSYKCTAFLPQVDKDNPEIERLWALSKIKEYEEKIQDNENDEAMKNKIVKIATDYSLVTDYTSMIVISEEEKERLGIKSKNKKRVEKERNAQNQKANGPIKNYRVDKKDENDKGMFNGLSVPDIGSGPVGPLFLLIAGWFIRRKKKIKK